MAITTQQQAFQAWRERVYITKTSSITTVATQWSTTFDQTGNPAAGSLSIGNTANGLVPTDATAGCEPIGAFPGGATGYLSSLYYSGSTAVRVALYDRVFHCGSYAYNSGTTNLSSQPSFSGRLPNTEYGGLQIWLEVNQAWASGTASSVTVTYTDQDGNTGATAITYVLPTAVITRRMFPVPLASGDYGVQKIESVQVSTTTGTPSQGTVNVVILRPLSVWRHKVAAESRWIGMDRLNMPIVYDDSALFVMISPDSTAMGTWSLCAEIISG